MQKPPGDALTEERRTLLFDQLRHIIHRVRLLHRALTCLYLALGVFVATSVAIGVSQVFNERYPLLPLALALGGAGLLFYTFILLIVETRIARTAIVHEMNFAWRLGQHYAPNTFVKQHAAYQSWFRKSK